ncbi:hypothetical protein [Streptomyces sp. NPDC001404]|uniref:hypothetical protein n=1 Tax=Streptomyces sp. NPDC001404 TaxID=3364571 RepID=UPI0036C67984
MRIRLHGTADECRRTADHLARVLDVLDASRPYPDRPPSRLVRIYLTANPPADTPPAEED